MQVSAVLSLLLGLSLLDGEGEVDIVAGSTGRDNLVTFFGGR